ncbi:MAG: sulfatase-like hydrolase/transferase [Akkermansiaceae bacterium]|nr:sulfatase-like hydrolase/transferase [Akkermansiaceae bacterium]
MLPRFLLFALYVFVSPNLGEAADRPNIVIFFTDDQGTLDAGCYGSDDIDTPAIDDLAASGVRFTQAYAHVVCCPSRAALMTGRHPQRSGVVNWTQGDRNDSDSANVNMPASEITLAEVLKASGYKTAIFGKWHLGAKTGHGPLDQGFDRHFGHLSGFIDNYRHHFMHGRGYHDLYDDNEEIEGKGKYFPDLMTGEALKYVDENKGSPFLMVVCFNLPHYPEQADEKFVKRYADLEMPRSSYAAVVSTVDDRIGRIVKKLEDLKLREKTVLIFMSDNGHSAENKGPLTMENHKSGYPKGHYYSANGGGGNTGKWIGHKGQYLEGGIRVPAIISYPGRVPKGEVREEAITVMDWFPTVLDLCGVAKPPIPIDGKSVLPLIDSKETKSEHGEFHWAWTNGWAVREGPWKLIGARDKGNLLVNLEDEEPERKNYLKEKPEVAARLLEMHLGWLQEVTPVK